MLVYMIRCAFAHDIMRPCWKVKPKYSRVLELEIDGCKQKIDLPALNGKVFEDSQIGGINFYLKVKDAVRDVS